MAKRSGSSKKTAQSAPEQIEVFRIASHERIAKFRAGANVLLALIGLGCVAVCIPIARIVVGTQTSFSVNISVGLNVALALTVAATSAAAVHQRSRARLAENEVGQLTGARLLDQAELKGTQKRIEDLEADLSRLRDDLVRKPGSR